MSPDSPRPSTQRKAWRVMSALGAVLAACSLFVSVWLYTQIQDSRTDAIRSQCEQTNLRHDQTLERLHSIVVEQKRGKTLAQQRQLDRSEHIFAFLFSASTPRRDCAKITDRLTSSAP